MQQTSKKMTLAKKRDMQRQKKANCHSQGGNFVVPDEVNSM